MLRTADEKRDVDRITLMSEVVAVADTYERIVSPSAGHEGVSPAAARPLMEDLAGHTLNLEIVRRFLASFPELPLGTEARVTAGPHLGMTGIVSAVHAEGAEPPAVRLFLDAAGRPRYVQYRVTLSYPLYQRVDRELYVDTDGLASGFADELPTLHARVRYVP